MIEAGVGETYWCVGAITAWNVYHDIILLL